MDSDDDERFLRSVFAAHDPAGAPSVLPSGASDLSSVPAARVRWKWPVIAAAAVAVIVVGISAVATAGFGFWRAQPAGPAGQPGLVTEGQPSQSDRPDITVDGKIAYACTLATAGYAAGAAAGWPDPLSNVDERTHEGRLGFGTEWVDGYAAAGLLGASAGAILPGAEDLRDPSAHLMGAVTRLETPYLRDALSDITAWCGDHASTQNQLTDSADDQAYYACALADAADAYGPVDSWDGLAVGDEAGPAFLNFNALPGLLGVLSYQPGSNEGPGQFGLKTSSSLTSMVIDDMQQSLDELLAWCRQ